MGPERPIFGTEGSVDNGELKENNKSEYAYDGILVFGHGYSDKKWKLSWEAWARAAAAFQLWKDGIAPKIILTGGDPSEKHLRMYGSDLQSNAEVMRDFLERHFKVPRDCMIIEDRPGSTKTVDNVGLALNALEQKRLPAERFVTVSTGYHLERITKIMNKFGLESQPVSAEQELNERALQHAEKMKQRELESGLYSLDEVQRRFLARKSRFDRVINKLKLKDPRFIKELENESKWQEAMNNWGYWGPLALCIKGDRLNSLVNEHKEDIINWLDRHPELHLSFEDLMLGNFNYREVVEKAREMPTD